MFANDDPSSIVARPVAAPVVNPGYFTRGNAGLGQAATIVTDDFLNTVMDELLNVVTAAGLTPNKSNNGQLGAALRAVFCPFFAGFTASGTWTAPAGITRAMVRVWGAAGGGGGAANTSSSASGAGPGGYSAGAFAVTPGTAYPVTVGVGGLGGVGGASPLSGSTGGASSFGGFLSATGGTGGGPSNSGVNVNNGGSGQGSGGAINFVGGAAGIGYAIGTFYAGGTGGAGVFGSSPTPNVGAPGAAGSFPGGGGNGSSANGPGGAGANGLVLIDY